MVNKGVVLNFEKCTLCLDRFSGKNRVGYFETRPFSLLLPCSTFFLKIIFSMCDKEHEVCEKLDNLAVNILDVMQKILNERQYLDAAIKNGFADIAKSRYVMGSNSVSLLQINESPISALRKVLSDDCINGDVHFKGLKISDGVEKNHSETLRHRSVQKETDSLINNFESCSISNSNTDKKKTGTTAENCKDPLRWFGVLVPNSLKSAQTNFVEAVKVAVHIASLQNELNAICDEYKKLLIQKKTLRAKKTESNVPKHDVNL